MQIGYLVDLYTGQTSKVKFSHYFLFSSFFPCVTAGPILLQKDMMPQFAEQKAPAFDKLRISVALTIFAIGLFKKLVLADSIAPYADSVFNGVADGSAVTMGMAWIGALAYTLQLYFDFSGYSDMAIGIGFLFGLRLPLNFNSPLKALSIIDFWRRWHMTMTRFFTNFLYTTFGVSLMRKAIKNRYGKVSRFVVAVGLPITLTMVLAGLWHGAGWTFIIFGLLHGLALATNHAWRQAGLATLPRPLAWIVTMAVVVTGMVVFRAADMSVAIAMIMSMTGMAELASGTASPGGAMEAVSVSIVAALSLIGCLGMIALLFPNTQEIMRDHAITSDADTQEADATDGPLTWRPSPVWAIATVVLIVASLGLITGETTFLYYQF